MSHLLSFCFFTFLLTLSGCRDSDVPTVEELVGKDGLLQTIIELAKDHYAQNVDTEKLVQGTINGALQMLDPFSMYYTERDYKTFLEMLKGEFGGIGVEMRFRPEGLEVISPLEDGPAHKVGMRSGDLIVTVNGKKVPQMTPMQILQEVHGKPGSTITIGYVRSGHDVKEVTISREIIKDKPVKFELIHKIAYFRLGIFNNQSSVSLLQAYDGVKRKLAEEEGKTATLKGVILDLRGNPGGTLDQALEVTSLFLQKSVIVNVESRDKTLEKSYESQGTDVFKGLPVVVLIDHGSASASEVLSGALRDHKRAILLGQKSYGKGSVQRIFNMGKKGAVSLTIAYFKTPKGHTINNVGLEPDIVVEQKDDKPSEQVRDLQKERAVDLLKGLSVLQNW